MTMFAPGWGIRMLAHDWRSGELRLLALALVIAVASITAVGGFSDRINQAFAQQAGQSMGGDLVIRSSQPIPAAVAEQATQHNLATARTLTFPSVVRLGEETVLATIQAVDENYPLRGKLRTADQAFATGDPREHGPAPGTLWADSRLVSLLQAGPGDSLAVGASQIQLEQVLISQPDGGVSFFAVAPRLLMHMADLDATGLIQPASRVRYRLLVAGAPADIERLRQDPVIVADEQLEIESLDERQPELRAAMQRGEQFLHLAALVSVILAGAAIALTARQYSRRHLDSAAVLRCMGASRTTLTGIHGTVIALTALAGCSLGVATGYLAQAGLGSLAAGLLGAPLPPPGPGAALTGALTGLLLFAGFALPPLLTVARTPPGRVLRREQYKPHWRPVVAALTAIIATMVLMRWHTGDTQLTLWVAIGTLVAGVMLALSGLLLVTLLDLTRQGNRQATAWHHGLASLARRRGETALLVTGFGLGISVLLLLGVVRNDLIGTWEASLGEDTPNLFLVNIQGHEREALTEMLVEAGLETPEFHPMVRARWRSHNDREVRGEDFDEGRTRRMALREFNLSWAAELPPDNRVSEGQWWAASQHGQPLLSMDADLAGRLDIERGDTLEFEIAGERLQLEVHNLREIQWDSFNANFFTLTPPGVLEDYPATWISALHLGAEHQALPAQLIRTFPSLGTIDVAAIIAQVREVIQRVSLSVQYVFVFTLLAGVIVLLATIQATREQRYREAALMRALGAKRATVLGALATEFAILGLVAGCVATLAAWAAGWLIAREVMELAYVPGPGVFIAGIIGSTLGIGLAGLLAIRPVLDQSPMRVLGAGT